MGGIAGWDAYHKYVEGGIKEGQYITGQFILIAAGPPHLSNLAGAGGLGAGDDVVFPIGSTQNFAVSQNRSFSRIFEIAGERSYFVPGRTVGQITLSRVWLHGASVLRTLYAYYQDKAGAYQMESMLSDTVAGGYASILDLQPWTTGAKKTGALHNVRIPAGYDNMFMNLASDLFSQPIGLLLVVRDTDEQNVGAVYFEQCVVPGHQWGVDSGGLITQESLSIQYERIVPIRINAVSLIANTFGHGIANSFSNEETTI